MEINGRLLGISYGRNRWSEVAYENWGDGVASSNIGHAVRLLEEGMRPHFVYFLEVRNDFLELPAMVKIGTSATPQDRITQLSRHLDKGPEWLNTSDGDCDYRCMGLLVGDEELEGQLHKAFASHRIAGEWFWLEPIEMAIDFLLSEYCVCQTCLTLDGWSGRGR
jgi:hypothetical protein